MVKIPIYLSCALLSYSCAAYASVQPHHSAQRDPARCAVDGTVATVENQALQFVAGWADGQLRLLAFRNHLAGRVQSKGGELFALILRDGRQIPASALRIDTPPSCDRFLGESLASRAADRRAGMALNAKLSDPATGLAFLVRVIVRDDSDYARTEIEITPAQAVDVAAVNLIDLDLPRGSVVGTVAGSPVTDGDRYFGVEDPTSVAKADSGHATISCKRVLPMQPGLKVHYSAVYGAALPGQLRRAFADYVEAERAHPFRPFLHYNSWYDIGYFSPYSQSDALQVIQTFGEQLVKRRGVRMDSFLFDDGWDDTSKLWQFNSGFPLGFTPLMEAAARYGAAPGIWLSPWGGYGKPRRARLETAKAMGYEVDEQGLALSGPKYYSRFHQVALDLLNKYGINQFKLDGTGSPDKVTPGSHFDSDFSAAISLIEDLRRESPNLFINLTTGTWPTPFWLRYADSIWRGGDDHAFLGVGSNRQQWMTYRDADTYGGIVRQGPWFPLNALMLHGLIYAQHAEGLNADPHADWGDEVWSYFASGTGLQEMYISAQLLTSANWDELARAARWARDASSVLRDSHWIGGDPARGQLYGWASWSPHHAIIALRNPTAERQSLRFDLGPALELPAGSPLTWRATPIHGHYPAAQWRQGKTVNVSLEPFQVVVWNLLPAGKLP